jgi:CrcB protein
MLVYLFVGIAGMAGALLRFYFGMTVDDWWNGWPAGTFFANMTGSFALAFFTAYAVSLSKRHPHLSTAIGTGLIGSFTTFSTFSVETIELMRGGQWLFAFLYVFFSLTGGLLLVAVGYSLGKRLSRTRKDGAA